MDETPPTEILDGTYRSLCTHGYANLTLEKIAAETETSKSLIYYHYETKQELFSAFLNYLYDRYTARLSSVDGQTPSHELDTLLEAVLTPEDSEPCLQRALLELTIQAHHEDCMQSKLADFETALVDRLHEIIESGVTSGVFDPEMEPDVSAEFLATMIQGTHTRQAASDCSVDKLHRTLGSYIESHLVAPEAVEPR